MKIHNLPIKKQCKTCSAELILSENKAKANVSPSEYKRKTPRCKCCMKINNAISNKKHKEKNKENYHKKREYCMNKPLEKTETEHFGNRPRKAGFTNIYEQYLTPRIYELPAVVESPMGTYKTQAVIDVILQNPDKCIVYLTANHTTLNSTQEVLKSKNIPYIPHTDKQFQEKTFIKKPGVITITPDSYHQLTFKPDILIIDEVHSVFIEAVTNKTEKNALSMNPHKRLNQLIDTYTRIIDHECYLLLDAKVEYSLFRTPPIQLIKNLYKKEKEINIYEPQPYIRDKFQEKFISEVLESFDTQETVSLQSDSVGYLDDTYQKLKLVLTTEQFQEVVIFTGHHNNKMKIKELNTYKIKLMSPKISRGVSVKSDIAYVYDTGRVLHPYIIFQMVDRARNSRVIHLGLNENKKPQSDFILSENIKAHKIKDHPLLKFQEQQQITESDRVNYIIELIDINYTHKVSFSTRDIAKNNQEMLLM